MMLRELARRPRNANAMETLRLARLRFPDIERIGKEMLPEDGAAKGYSIEDWRDFLYFMADSLRSYYELDVDDGEAGWKHGRERPRNEIGQETCRERVCQ